MKRLFASLMAIAIPLYGALPSLPKNYLPLPLIEQETDYSCGPASFLSIAKYWDVFHGAEEDLYGPMNTSQMHGTHPKDIVRVAKELKLKAYLEERVTVEKLRESLKRGATVILDLQAWREDTSKPWVELWEDGHYLVLAGLDDKYLYAMDPSAEKKYGYMPLEELYDRWHDFEIEKGQIWKHYQLAIFIEGAVPGKPFTPPKDLVRIE